MKFRYALLLSSVVAFSAVSAMAQDTTAQPPGQAAGPRAGGPGGGRGPGGPGGAGGAGGAANRFQTGQRAPPSEGGAYGTITGVSGSSFSLSAPSGRSATVVIAPTTTIRLARNPAATSAVAVGQRVRVLGIVDFGTVTTITATRIVLQPTEGAGSEASLTTAAAAFAALPKQAPRAAGGAGPGQGRPDQGAGQAGVDHLDHRVGQVPAVYVEGGGTIVVGAEADKATEAGMGAPWGGGGMINRVVKLSDGSYEVHNIGTSWPHHLFVNADFKATGAD